jgi:hypothetical protein
MASDQTLTKGDKVRFLNEKGEGTIARIDKKYVYVLVTEGFEIPVLPSEIVVVEKAGDQAAEQKVKHNTGFQVNYNYAGREDDFEYTQENVSGELTNELYLGVVKGLGKYEIYLINPGDFYIYYHIGINQKFADAGKLEPGMQALIVTKDTAGAGEWGSIQTQCLCFHPAAPKMQEVIHHDIKAGLRLLPDMLYIENDFFDEPALILDLLEKHTKIPDLKPDPEILIAEKEMADDDKSKRFQKRPEKEIVEVDLHIEKLLDNFKGMSNHEMLTFQMNHFRKELEAALQKKDKISRIVFIHGIGNGTLKLQLRKQLEDLYPFLYYQDASFAEYGFGATMVMVDRIRK